MPETIEGIFKVLLKDESWTWWGLAEFLVGAINKDDLESFKSCLELETKKQYFIKE
jgi:hypothetical protein